MNYRRLAKAALKRAKCELDKDDEHLKYAALELRMTLESLIYERATLYEKELSCEKLSTWQPKQLLDILLEIDPYAAHSRAINIGIQKEQGLPSENLSYLGTDRLLSLKNLKKYYHRLSSYLHPPTLTQPSSPPQKIRKHCVNLIVIIERVLESSIFKVDFKVTSTMDCLECGTNIVRRIPSENEMELIAECLSCQASYKLKSNEDKVTWIPIRHELQCINQDCNCTHKIWDADLKVGKKWQCTSCKTENELVLALASSTHT